MTARRRTLIVLFVLLAVAAAAPALVRSLLERWEDNSVLRGRRVAEARGCLGCHLPPTSAEIPNPGSRWGTVPRFRGGNALMYGPSREEIEKTIRFGSRGEPGDSDAPEKNQRVLMPAYGPHLTGSELSDLLDYVCSEERVDLPGDEAVAAGREIARVNGCTACHGIEGSGGVENPESLGGFVPGFLGRNFLHLVQDREELGEWIHTGTSKRLAANPIIARFWRRQRLSMPAYDTLEEQELDQLWAWIQAMRRWSDRDAAGAR